MKLTDEELLKWPDLKRLDGEEVTLVYGGRWMRSKVQGIVRVAAGCGETEPSWYTPAMEFMSIPSGVKGTVRDSHERIGEPLLVKIGNTDRLSVYAAQLESVWPDALMTALSNAELPLENEELFRTGSTWTVYSDRVVQSARLGAVRTTWVETDGNFKLLHRDITNTSYENLIMRYSLLLPGLDIEKQISGYRSFVGRVHAFVTTNDMELFLTRYQGYESERTLLEKLHDGRMETVRVNGFDRGC